ncbi:uncharacterized protein LOC144635589 [Oculina patagonica]
MAENMALKAVLVMVIYLLASCAAKQNCSEIQCKLLPVKEDIASEFLSLKNSKNGVRMIYLKLKIGNESYHPLELQNEFLPDRWVWAATIDELMLSLSYDYDILSLGLLKRQVRQMDMQLEDEPSGCLAALNSSCQNIVVVFDGDVEFRCCKRVKQGRLPKCELSVQRSNWFKAFYVVLNVLTVFMGIYSPALFFLLPDYIFDVRKECAKEQQQEEEEEKQRQKEEMEIIERRLRQNGYQHLPSSQELQDTEESSNANDGERVMLSRLKRPATLTEANNSNANDPNANEPNSVDPNSNEPNANEQSSMVANLNDPNSNEPNSNDPDSNQPNSSDPNSNEPNSVDPNLNEWSNTNEPNSNGPVTSTTTKKEDEEKRKVDEFPLDDGSPFNISTLIYTCKSAEVFRDYSTKLSFNIKLAFLWFCVIPVFFYTELALGYTLKDEFLDEIARKDAAILVGGLFFIFDMTELTNRVILVVSYVVIPFIIILILRPKDLNEERTRLIAKVDTTGATTLTMITHKVYIGEQVLQRFKKNREIVDKILRLAKVPIIVYKTIQNVCDDYIKIGAPRRLRFFWVLLKTLFFSVCAVLCSFMTAAICLFLILFCTTVVLVSCSPYFIILLYFPVKFYIWFIKRLPLLWLLLRPSSPQFFFFYLHDCYSSSQNKYKKVKEIISQEWQAGLLDKNQKSKVTNDTIPKKLFLVRL